eukprot:2668493-Rhodomonas_salina.2
MPPKLQVPAYARAMPYLPIRHAVSAHVRYAVSAVRAMPYLSLWFAVSRCARCAVSTYARVMPYLRIPVMQHRPMSYQLMRRLWRVQ